MDNTQSTFPAPDTSDTTTESPGPRALPAPRRRFTLHRSRTDVMLGGVCGGLAEQSDLDPALIRIAVATLTFFTGGAAAVVYLAAWILVPMEGTDD